MDSLLLSQKIENNNINYNFRNEDIGRSIAKSITYNICNDYTSFDNNLNDNQNNNYLLLQKSRTCRENEIINMPSFTFRFNNLRQNHLETVLETVSEVSNSKVDSSKISDNKENNENSENINKINDKTQNEKTKEEIYNNNTEQKIQGFETRINDSNNNTITKKSFYFLSSEKTH